MIFLALLCVTAASKLQAQTLYQSIQAAVDEFARSSQLPYQDVSVRITSLENKIALSPCKNSLDVNLPSTAPDHGNSSLLVSCMQPAWKIHVPVFIDGLVNVAIASRAIFKGMELDDTNTRMQKMSLSQLHYGYFSKLEQVQGMESLRNIRNNQVITPGIVMTPKWVKRGHPVSILAKNGRLTLRVKGKAMADGRQGQVIKVKNLSSQKVIFAKVSGPGEVEVNI